MSGRIRPLAEQWADFAEQVLDGPNIGDVQRREMRRAFYAGAESLLRAVMLGLEPGVEPTDEDIRRMEEIDADLKAFAEDVKAGRA